MPRPKFTRDGDGFQLQVWGNRGDADVHPHLTVAVTREELDEIQAEIADLIWDADYEEAEE